MVTFLVNLVGGGGCSAAGAAPRGSSAASGRRSTPQERARRSAGEHASRAPPSAGALVLSLFAWWVDLAVFWRGSPRALLVAWGLLAICAALAYAHGRWMGAGASARPPARSASTTSFVSPARWFGVHFRNQEASCIECDACDNACPVDLAPRDLMALAGSRGGLSLADAPGRNHCLECGDCVRACEWMIDRAGDGPVPLLMGFFDGPQRVAEPAAEPAPSGPESLAPRPGVRGPPRPPPQLLGGRRPDLGRPSAAPLAGSVGGAPARVRPAVAHQPAPEELGVGAVGESDPRPEGPQRPVQPPQVVEGHGAGSSGARCGSSTTGRGSARPGCRPPGWTTWPGPPDRCRSAGPGD